MRFLRKTHRLPQYVSECPDRHGKMRVRFRRKGFKEHYFKAAPWTDDFMKEYAACLAGEAAPKIKPGASQTQSGTINALIVYDYQTAEFTELRPSTQAVYRGMLERF